MKKLLALLMGVVLCLSMCSCNLVSNESSYEKTMHNEMKKYTGKWVEAYEGEIQDDDLYVKLFDDGVYMIFNISASDILFDELDLEHHGNRGTWDVRNGMIYFHSTSDGGREDVDGFKILDENTIELAGIGEYTLVRVETY